MTIEEVIRGFQEDVKEDPERNAYANELFQEAIRIGMELNCQYRTPEELREIMGRLTGRPIDDSFRLFPPFYTDFGKNIRIGKDVFINSGCHFQDQGGIEIGDGVLRRPCVDRRQRHRSAWCNDWRLGSGGCRGGGDPRCPCHDSGGRSPRQGAKNHD